MFSVADFVTALGWFGAVAGAAAYLLVSRGRWNAASARYQSANFLGAGLMGGVAAFNGIWPSAAANLIWVVIGGQTLWVIHAKKRADREAAAESVADLEPCEALVVSAPAPAAPAFEEHVLDEVWEERDPTLRMTTAELAALSDRGVAVAA
ncbi:hypothetical protein [Mumia sp. Pv 4-285]|uniref:hypothetical protein n=1 Tax=Mumia qirimensis TaxID=3234852 RepID=UPI00351D00FF